MKRGIFLAAVTVCIALAARSPVSRGALFAMEQSFKQKLTGVGLEMFADPRAVYLEGYGAVFTADVGLTFVPAISPFQPTLSKEQISQVYRKKLAQYPVLRETMRQMLLDASASLDAVPMNEQIALGITLSHATWEQTAGIPSQIVMRGQRQQMLDVKLGKLKAPLETVIREQEF